MRLQWVELLSYKNDKKYLNDEHVKLVANDERVANLDNMIINCLEGMLVVKTNCKSMAEIKELDFELIDSIRFIEEKDLELPRNLIINIQL